MAHGYLSYSDTRGEVDWLGKALSAIQDYLDKKEQKEKIADAVAAKVIVHENAQKALPQGETPLLKGGAEKQIAGSPLQKMLGGTALQRSLPGAVASQPDVVGGPLAKAGFSGKRLKPEGFVSDQIVDIGATNLGYERDLGGSDMFVKTLSDVSGDSSQVVQAIDRLTMVTMTLVSATQEQTNSQKQIAAAQQQHSDKLARKSIAAAEESSLEQGGDLSGNSAYLALAGQSMMGGRGGRGGGPGMGIGGKVMAKKLLGAATKRGAARTGTRLGAAMGGKLLGGFGKRAGAKLGAKGIGKVAGGAIAKSLGKKIPLVGLGLGAVFAAQRAMQGDFLGAGLELASGAASTVPGLGTAGSIGIDAALAARDMTAMAEGGITDGPVNALIGEAGREGVFPLEGSEGKKTFIKFGEGIFEAQKRNKREFAKLQAAGLSEYYDKKPWWQGLLDGLKDILGAFSLPGFGKLFKFDDDDDDDDSKGKGGTGDGVSGEKGDPNLKLGSAEEARIAAALVTEGAGGTASTDILQVLANRMAHGGYGDSYTDLLSRKGQFHGVYARYGEDEASINRAISDFKGINSIEDAAAFAGVSEKVIKQRIADMRNAELRKSSAEHVGGALEFRAAPGYYTRNGLVEGEMGADGRFYGSKWRGGAGDNQFLTTAGKDPMLASGAAAVEYEGISTPTTTTEEEPKPTGNWASKLKHFGFNHSYIDFGPDNKYRAIKMDNGYTIHKKGFIQRRVSTDDGANMWLMDSLLEAGNARVKSATTTPNLDPSGDQSSLSPDDDGSTALSAASSEVALADTATVASTTIINNNYSGGSGNGSTTVGNQVDFGPSNSDLGGDVYSNTRIRTLVG